MNVKRLTIWTLGPQLVVLLQKDMESSSEGWASLEEVGHQKEAWMRHSLAPLSVLLFPECGCQVTSLPLASVAMASLLAVVPPPL